jgi:hemerythrin-like domain-containing protein
MATTRAKSGSTAKTSPKSKSKTASASASPKKGSSAVETESVKRFDGRSTKQPTALAFLMKQHREVEGWFEEYENADDARKAELSAQICQALKIHTQIEEELLYPPAHAKLDDEDMVDEAYVEHDSAKSLIAQIEAMKVGDHMYDAKVKVLSEYIKHHVCEEETELFPAIAKSDIDLAAIGRRLEARAEELKGNPGRVAASSEAKPEARPVA